MHGSPTSVEERLSLTDVSQCHAVFAEQQKEACDHLEFLTKKFNTAPLKERRSPTNRPASQSPTTTDRQSMALHHRTAFVPTAFFHGFGKAPQPMKRGLELCFACGADETLGQSANSGASCSANSYLRFAIQPGENLVACWPSGGGPLSFVQPHCHYCRRVVVGQFGLARLLRST
jgi:hypothetical protein